ncbi:MAG: hypothetical protein ACRC7O_15265 [Fimbriiglobus sp.]
MTLTAPATGLRFDLETVRFDARHTADAHETPTWAARPIASQTVPVSADEDHDWDRFQGYF